MTAIGRTIQALEGLNMAACRRTACSRPGRWDNITRVKPPMAQVDPLLPVTTGRSRAAQ
jgi:hypothetical protein